MSVILKPLFDVLTGDVTVMNNILYNYLIMLAVGEIAYRVAWDFVGDLYRIGMIDGKASGSIIHWIIRLIFYVVCAYFIRIGIWLYEFVVDVPHWIWWILLGITVAIVIVVISINFNKQKPMITKKVEKTGRTSEAEELPEPRRSDNG